MARKTPTKQNTRDTDIAEVKEMWETAARKKKDSPLATTHDRLLRDLEVAAVARRIPDTKGLRVLDAGCGNGFSTLEYARMRHGKFSGIDFSEQMIQYANVALKKRRKSLKGAVSFAVGDILNLDFDDATFDIVTTGRCLVNMVTIEDQKKAIKEIHRVLKKGGHAILCEGTQQGFESVNELRKIASLPQMKYHWHNIYLDESVLVPFMRKHFEVLEIDPFASTYYLASRIFNALSATDPKNPDYFSAINKIAAKLPSVGNYSPLKVFYLRKK